MNYTLVEEAFGPYTKLTIKNDTGASFCVIPQMGARLNSFIATVSGSTQEIIDGYTDLEQLQSEYYSKGSLLAPFPNRTADGHYTFADMTYQLPINKPDEHNAIHGFVSDEVFTIVTNEAQGEAYVLALEYLSAGAEGFPFPFKLKVTYRFTGQSLHVETILTNAGPTAMPAGFGWHPYFTVGTTIDDLYLRLPAVERLAVDERLIPTGITHTDKAWNSAKPLGSTQFDTGFVFTGSDKQIVLAGKERGIKIAITCEASYEYVQVFTPPWRSSIAIEPMTCAADALNNGRGLRTLAPGEHLDATFSIEVESEA